MQKAARIIGIIAIVVVIFTAMIISFNQKVPNSEKIWDQDTTIGNIDAENYFIIYSDFACPYCIAFENAIIEHEEEFQKYIEENDILLEIRLSDYLYEYGQSSPISSRYSSEAAYCAKKEGKFWDYYNHTITSIWNSFFKTLGKSAFMELNQQDKNYWIKLGTEVGLGEKFANCVKNNETIDEIEKVAAKMVKNASGLPYFKFNKYIFDGFNLSDGWEHVKMHFNSGLKSR